MPFDSAASATLQGGAPQATPQVPAAQQLLQIMVQHGMLGGGKSPDLNGITFGNDPGQPSAPARFKPPDIEYSKPQGSFATVGERQRADSQALYHGIASTVKSAGDFLQEKKTRAMSMDTSRLMSAMSGLNEAKASGDQAAMQHNAQIINDMMTDPKKVKMFEKVFNVPLMGDDKKKNTPEYKGFMDAMKKFQTDKGASTGGLNPRAAMLANAMPQRMQTDPRLAALMEATKAGVVPTANAQLKANTEIAKVLTTAQEKGYDRASKESIAKTLADSRDRATNAGIMRTVISAIGREGAAEIIAKASKYRADKMYDSVMKNPKWEIMKSKLGKEVEDKSLKGFSDAIDKQMKSLQADKKQVDTDVQKDTSWFKDKKLLQRQQELNKQIDALRQKQDAVTNYYMQKHDDGLEDAIPESDSDDKEFDLTPEEQQQLQELYQ